MTLQDNKNIKGKFNKGELVQSTGRKNLSKLLKRLLTSEYFVLYLCIVYFLVLTPFVPRLASLENIKNILSNMWPLLAIAIGQTVVLLIAGIDLSQGSIISFTSVVGALIMTSNLNPVLFEKSPVWGWLVSESGSPVGGTWLALPLGILAMLITGSLIGILNGVSIAKFNMPPFMVTLVAQLFFRAFAIFTTKSENVRGLPQAFKNIGSAGIGIIPYSAIITIILAVVAHLMLSKTVLGRWVYSTGNNVKASIVSGVPVKKITIFAYAFSGFCAAVGSMLYSARLEMGRPTLGDTMLMDIIGATVIGGTSLFGGKGKVVWTVFGVLFFVVLANTLNLLNLSYFTINIVKGGVILLAALLDVTRTRLLAADYSSEKAGN